jgi:[protein-PII] uridylyltransferase
LSKVGQAFRKCGTRLYNARISTIGSRAEDIFYITGPEERPLAGEAEKRRLCDEIMALVGPR